MRSNIRPSDIPPVPAPALPRDLDALRLLLGQGWQIETPVLARLSWAQHTSGERSYHVILARASQRTLIVLPTSPLVERFLSEHHIPIN